MIASWVPWPILAGGYRTRRWAISCVATESLLPPNENTRPAGKISSTLIWMFWWVGFLHCGSAYSQGIGYLLRVVLYPVGGSEGLSGRNHAPSGPQQAISCGAPVSCRCANSQDLRRNNSINAVAACSLFVDNPAGAGHSIGWRTGFRKLTPTPTSNRPMPGN